MKKTIHNFCCDSMNIAIKENKIIDYDITVREYGMRFRKNRVKMLNFCPWCGIKLPKDLIGELYDVLEKEYNIPWRDADIFEYTNVPDEFKTDEWWKKRDL